MSLLGGLPSLSNGGLGQVKGLGLEGIGKSFSSKAQPITSYIDGLQESPVVQQANKLKDKSLGDMPTLKIPDSLKSSDLMHKKINHYPQQKQTTNTQNDTSDSNLKTNNTYDFPVDTLNFYYSYPYKFTLISDNLENPYNLDIPIAPNNLNITTSIPNIVTPTMSSIITERSPIKVYQISISGTTGASSRDAYQESAITETLNKINSTIGGGFLNKIVDLAQSGEKLYNKISGFFGPAGSKVLSGIKNNQNTGYAKFHALYNGLVYMQNICTSDKTAKIYFVNTKDNNKYEVAPVNFTLTRSAENPMLYNYNIELIGYNLTTVEGSLRTKGRDESAMLSEMGLDGVITSSYFGEISETVGGAKDVLKSAKGIANIFK